MAAIEFRADIKIASDTLAAIEAAVRLQALSERPRPHLGASQIGKPCSRALWYAFHWASKAQFEPRLLRLFARGQREEQVFADLLRAAGVTVHLLDAATGRQFRFEAYGGHFAGSMDGAALDIPEAPKTWHVLEFKTHNRKSFDELTQKGVQAAKPEHYSQMQVYMRATGMQRALYCAVCKDDDRLHIERVDFDADHAELMFRRAEAIINAAEPPQRYSEDPSYYLCKWCEFRDMCHGDDLPLPHCRSCAHATPESTGGWSCARHDAQQIPLDFQENGCDSHRYIPILLDRFAEIADASHADNWVRYRLKSGQGEFVNGQPPAGLSSAEIHACAHKDMLVDETVQVLREQLSARITEHA